MSPRRSSAGGELPVADRDQVRLQQLGYKQELKRGLSYVPDAISLIPSTSCIFLPAALILSVYLCY
jgi:hypothetical protein